VSLSNVLHAYRYSRAGLMTAGIHGYKCSDQDFRGHNVAHSRHCLSHSQLCNAPNNVFQTTKKHTQSRRRPPRSPRPVSTKVKGPHAVVVKCNVGRYHGTIIAMIAQRAVFTVQRHANDASTVYAYAIVVCLPAFCLSQVGVLLKWPNAGSSKGCLVIAQGL